MLKWRQVDMATGGPRRRKQRQVAGEESHTSGGEVRGGGGGRGGHGGVNLRCGSVDSKFLCKPVLCSLREEGGAWDGGSAIGNWL